MSKICTDLNQSKKLIELGLNESTSDMHWWPKGNGFELIPIPFKNDNNVPEFVTKEVIPAWSLSKLLELMDVPDDDGRMPRLGRLYTNPSKWRCYYNSKNFVELQHCNNPLDAAFEMIVWLLKNNYLRNDNRIKT